VKELSVQCAGDTIPALMSREHALLLPPQPRTKQEYTLVYFGGSLGCLGVPLE